MASRNDLLAECAQQLRASNFEYEALLGASLVSVWQALGQHIARQLASRKGVAVAQLGRFGFYKSQTSTLPTPPVFLLADRFTAAYGVVWRHRPPPAPLTATTEVNMATLGSEASLGHDQTRRALDAFVAFLGKKLQGGSGTGRLVLIGVGTFTLDGKALSFSFDPNLVRTIMESARTDISPPPCIFRSNAVQGLRRKTTLLSADAITNHSNRSVLQRSGSLDGVIHSSGGSAERRVSTLDLVTPSHGNVLTPLAHREATGPENVETKRSAAHDKTKEREKHHRETRHKADMLKLGCSNSTGALPSGERQILPRFLIPEPRVPARVVQARAQHERSMQTAFQRELTRMAEAKYTDDQQNEMLATRQRAVQLRDLQARAEQTVARKELNAFLNGQIEEKQQRAHLRAAAAARDRVDYRAIKILPLEPEVSDETRRAEKKKLNQRLNEQVAAKVALKKDRRVVDQAESAYFISKLMLQAENERQELLEQKRTAKETLLAGWNQQKAIRAQRKAQAFPSR